MVYVRKVEMYGFKSFGFKKTVVNLRPGLTSISGPNGSGKSNILDAITFATGDNNHKMMRVGRLKELIHDVDSSKRGKITSVSIDLDNTDRRIPVNSDSVQITREMDENGESVYYINKKKKTHRNHIQNILGVASAGPDQLNVIRQGTVTRISEYSPDERRKIIEDQIGLSDFDEKTAEANKTLDEADRKLENTLVKMDDIKSSIDDLDEERNMMLRYNMLKSEIAQLKIVLESKRLRRVAAAIEKKAGEKKCLDSEMATHKMNREEKRREIGRLDAEKSELLEKSEAHAQKKFSIESKLSETQRKLSDAEIEIKMVQNKIEGLEKRIPEIDSEITEIRGRKVELESSLMAAEQEFTESGAEKKKCDDEIADLDRRIEEIVRETEVAARQKSLEARKVKAAIEEMGNVKSKISRLKGKREDLIARIDENFAKRESYGKSLDKMKALRARLDTVIAKDKADVRDLKLKISQLEKRKSKASSDARELGLLLEKSGKASVRYRAKISAVKEMMHEDYSAARLMEKSKELGVLGLAYELLSWEKEDERAVMAAGSDWIRAIVVKDFETLASLAEYVKRKDLPKLRIVPLDVIPEFKPETPKIAGALGMLSERVECAPGHSALGRFIFGNIVLADSRKSARRLSKSGYKAVTREGEFFEANAAAMILDINSKISRLEKIISMSTSIGGLAAANDQAKKYLNRMQDRIDRSESGLRVYQNSLADSKTAVTRAEGTLTQMKDQTDAASSSIKTLSSKIASLRDEKSILESEIAEQESAAASLERDIPHVESDDGRNEGGSIYTGLIEKRRFLIERQSEVLERHEKARSELARLQARAEADKRAIVNLEDEKTEKSDGRRALESKAGALEEMRQSIEDELIKLRDREQEIIAEPVTSIDAIKEYDERLRVMNADEKSLAREISRIERKKDSLSRDLGDLGKESADIRATLDALGFKGEAEEFDAESTMQALEEEIKSMPELNAKAPKAYLEVTDGYRGISEKKNILEAERNSIVEFIEGIEQEKKQTFLDAFGTVDREIRSIFSSMNGGEAWLEIEDEDDIFASGMSYMIQFPNKQKRESTSISGGEKTLAAIVFLLALQKLKPSPFYLFDEVDAHLDAQNSERLANILEERAKESQFIMVSLKESVAAKADLMYGVYPKNGISHVLAYKDKRVPPAMVHS